MMHWVMGGGVFFGGSIGMALGGCIIVEMERMVEVRSERQRAKVERQLSRWVDIRLPVWMLTSGSARQVGFDKISKRVVGYNMTTLVLSNNQYPAVLTHFAGASFQYLLVLNLSNNSLVSAEALISLQAPYLEALYLDKNLISNIKSLRKFVHKSLKILDVSMNQLRELTHIEEFHCPQLKQLSLYRNEAVALLEPFLKSSLNPPLLVLTKMGFVSHTAKRDFIDFAFRRPLHGELPRTRI